MARMNESNTTLITSRSEFLDAVLSALRETLKTPAGLVFCEVANTLGPQAHSNWVLTLLTNPFDVVAQRHPLGVAWRRNGFHVVNCQQANEADSGHRSTQLLIPGQGVVRLIDPAY